MFSRIVLHNFLSFSDVEFDLERVRGEPRRIAMVYGENGSGKTNLIESVMFLRDSARMHRTYEPERGTDCSISAVVTPVSEGMNEMASEFFTALMRSIPPEDREPSLSRTVRGYMTSGAADMSAGYSFYVDGRRTEYGMRFDADGKLVEETLRTVIGSKFGNLYAVSNDGNGISVRMSPSFITDAGYRREVQGLIDRYWGGSTLLGILNDQYATKNRDFMARRVSRTFDDIRRYIGSVVVCMPSDSVSEFSYPKYWDGWTSRPDAMDFASLEDAYSSFFGSVDGTTVRVRYETEKVGADTHYYLVFDRKVGGGICSIPYRQESSGIRKLARMLPAIAATARGRTVFIDEMDPGIHDIMMSELMESICESNRGQLIFTTHDTELLENADPDSAYALSVDPDGLRSMRPFKKVSRVQKSNSLRRQYLRGAFTGVPYVGYINLDGIASRMPASIEDPRWPCHTDSGSWQIRVHTPQGHQQGIQGQCAVLHEEQGRGDDRHIPSARPVHDRRSVYGCADRQGHRREDGSHHEEHRPEDIHRHGHRSR